MTSKIEWTERTWNPVIGCTKVSPGCKNCYAATMANRLKAMGVPGYENGFNKITLMPNRLKEPLSRQKPSVYFVNSMSDLFHPDVPDDYIEQVMVIIAKAPQHTFQILTKHSLRMQVFFETKKVPDNAWLGVSVEDKKYGLPRIDHLQNITASIRFISIEPLLEDLGIFDLTGIQWVIVGGESGSKARPMKPEWVESIKARCDQYPALRFFFKQWGSYGPDGVKRAKRNNGRLLQGQIWDAMPTINGSVNR